MIDLNKTIANEGCSHKFTSEKVLTNEELLQLLFLIVVVSETSVAVVSVVSVVLRFIRHVFLAKTCDSLTFCSRTTLGNIVWR